MAKKRKPVMSSLERAILSRERGIRRMEQAKKNAIRQGEIAMEAAREQCAVIDRQIATKRELLDALRRGASAQ